jgi:putative RNA 2'-phosphotransferase
MSLVLRHRPEAAGLRLDESGWVDFEKLAKVLRKRFALTNKRLLNIIENNPKKRFQLEGNKIRAAQGHSVKVDLKLDKTPPPATLYHGTTTQIVPQILAQGLTKQARHAVHLSPDIKTAKIVAIRRKQDWTILAINTTAMTAAGHEFFCSENNVWLTDHVPPQFLTLLSDEQINREFPEQ